MLQWVDKVKKQRRKQREDFIRFLIEDLGSELEYQYDVKDSEDKVIRKGQCNCVGRKICRLQTACQLQRLKQTCVSSPNFCLQIGDSPRFTVSTLRHK